MKTPDPEQLRELLNAGLAIMAPNDPAKLNLAARLAVLADCLSPIVTLSFYSYAETPCRECYGSGQTAEEALEDFRTNYKAPLTPAERAAELRRQADELEAGQ